MRILGLDIGERKVGIAISDETGFLARGLGSTNRDGNEFEKIKKLVEEYKVEKIIYGLPVKLDSSISAQTEKTLFFVQKLKEIISIQFVPWDERLTTKEAENILIEADLSRKKRKKLIDKLSAQIILQDYLNSQNPKEEELT